MSRHKLNGLERRMIGRATLHIAAFWCYAAVVRKLFGGRGDANVDAQTQWSGVEHGECDRYDWKDDGSNAHYAGDSDNDDDGQFDIGNFIG
jgi:hypothetical protein